MKKLVINISLIMLLAITIQVSHAGLIIQEDYTIGGLIVDASPVGQTFTAEDSYIKTIGFYIADWNPHTAPDDHDLTAELYSGVGNGGTLIKTITVDNIADGYSGWLLFELGSVALNLGDKYSMFVIDDTLRWAIYSNQHSYASGDPLVGRIDYIGGDAILGGNVIPYKDLVFMVVPVPEPMTLSLFALGGLVLIRRRK